MREIMFRGKRCDNDEWAHGFYVRADHHWHEHGVHKDWIICGASANGGWFALRKKYAVKPGTVGQFTGKVDKNGKKVFEHDVLQTFTVWDDGTVKKCDVGVVQWQGNDQCYVLATKEGYHIDDFGNYGRPEYFEVIGNIHDNPELSGERKDNGNEN